MQGFQPGGMTAGSGGVRPIAAPLGGAPAAATIPGAPAGFRSVGAPVSKPGSGAAPPGGPALPSQPASCWVCGQAVSGVFLQVKGQSCHHTCIHTTLVVNSLGNI